MVYAQGWYWTLNSTIDQFLKLKVFLSLKKRMSHWVAGHITGGLGNRLFQHAAAAGLAERWGHRLVFYLPKAAPTNHGPFDNVFRLFPSVPVVSEEQSHLALPEPSGYVFTYLPFQSDPIGSNILVDGWRQTARYFPAQGIHADLEGVLTPSRKEALLQKYGLESTRETTCFVHIRLGDYKILPHHQIDIGTYVLRASKHFPSGSRFLVFSDEAREHKSMLEGFVSAVGHTGVVVEEEDELEALWLMSQCWGGAIVGNSTFSWWGAYFARQRCPTPSSFKACYPTVWGAGLPPARDVVPSWGIAVSNT